MRLKNLDLIITIAVALINVGWVLLPNRPSLLGTIFVLPSLFVLPGYALTEALFRRSSTDADALTHKVRLRLERPFGMSDRLIISLGLSFAIDIICGFVLNMLPMGLQALSWAVALGLLTTI